VKQKVLHTYVESLLRKRQRMQAKAFDPLAVKSILFVELTRFGDVVNILPAVQSFRDACPHARISVAVLTRFAELFPALPFVDETIPFDENGLLPGFAPAAGNAKERTFDLVCSMSPAARNGLIALKTTANAYAGYFDVHGGVTPFLERSSIRSAGVQLVREEVFARENISVRALKLCSALGVTKRGNVTWKLPEEWHRRRDEQLSSLGVDPLRPYIVIHPFAGWTYREWHHASALAAGIMRESPAVIVGTREEHGRLSLDGNGGFAETPFFEITGEGALASLLKSASLVIGADSGPLHLAASLGTKTLGLYGPASPALTAPQSKSHRSLYHNLECSPCDQLACIHPERSCMEYLTVEAVLAAALEQLRVPVTA
jgi:ADP-heptose:LPS heptosyltransferase